jgi:hypothetical protein
VITTTATVPIDVPPVAPHGSPVLFPATAGTVILAPKDHILYDLTKTAAIHEPTTPRPRGTAELHTLDALVSHALRHAGRDDTVAFCALVGEPTIIVVYDYHPPSSHVVGGWCEHRAVYRFHVDPAWARWTKAAADGALTTAMFARLIEDGWGELREPTAEAPAVPGLRYATPSQLLLLAEGLTVHVDQEVCEQRREADGTTRVSWSESTTARTADAHGPIAVPNGFLLGLPVFVGGVPYAVPARLRLGVAQRKLTWTVALHGAEAVRRAAIEAAATRFREATQVPVFFGVPDK